MMAYDYPHPVSRTYQYRKITKPLLERKRRARINRCLDELKDLMVDALETEGEDISKLEKADILELTVRHLQRLHASRPSGLLSSGSPNEESATGVAENRWQSGFGHCAAEACRYLAALPGESGERLARHLASGLRGTQRRNITVPRIKNSSPIVRENCDSRIADSPIERSATAPIDSRTTESPIDFPRCSSNASVITDLSDKLPISGQPLDKSSTDLSISKSNPIFIRNGPLTVIPRITDVKTVRIDGRQGIGEDEEEIDVEGVDEGDPMWRPW